LISVWPNISLIVTPSCSRAHSNTVTPTDSPALMTERSRIENFFLGSGTAFIMSFNAVGKRKEFRIPYFSRSA
jgi:hypothetical protein